MVHNSSDERLPGLRIERLTESYRFDSELARILTQFQYRDDGIALTAAESRPLPAHSVDPATAGQQAVFESDSSLVFLCYDNREHAMVNPIEVALIEALTAALSTESTARPSKTAGGALAEGPAPESSTTAAHQQVNTSDISTQPLSVGVVTPHNAQRGALTAQLPDEITANTVEKYQGDERDAIVVSATVSDPRFARQEDRFILNARRLLVAISRSRLLTVVVCSTALFEVGPQDSDRLANGPLWARLFTQAVGCDPQPAWTGRLGEFIGDSTSEDAGVPVRAYPSTIGDNGGS